MQFQILNIPFIILSFILFQSCTNEKTYKTWEGTGTLQIGFETSSFEPEGISGYWWVSFKNDSIANIYYKNARKAKSVDYNPNIYFFKSLNCNLKGKISKLGTYGHLGMYIRKIVIEELWMD
jgi:hypothetical protein